MEREITVNGHNEFAFEDLVAFDQHHQRQEVSFHTPDLEVFSEKFRKGWTFKRTSEGFLMRAPEEWLVDMTDPYKITHCGDPVCNLAYYKFFKKLTTDGSFNEFADFIVKKKRLEGFKYRVLSGPALETEIRVAGSDSRIKDLKRELLEEAILADDFGAYRDEAQNFLQGCRGLNYKKIPIESAPVEVSSFFYLLKQHYGLFDNFKIDAFNPLFFPDLLKDIPESDVYVFIPWGCFRYVSSFVNQTNRDKIMFWELHHDDYQVHTNRYLSKDMKGKRVLILDNSYTGNTLTRAMSLVLNEGGIPSRLALFPKSRLSVVNSEYVLFVDKVLKSDSLDLSNSHWVTDTYKKVLKCD